MLTVPPPPPAYNAPSSMTRQNVQDFTNPGLQNLISGRKATGAFPSGVAALSSNPLFQHPGFSDILKLLKGGLK